MKNLYYCLFVLLMATASLAQAQPASQYYFQFKTGVALENMTSGATTLLGSGADEVVTAPVPFFPFTFAGTSYQSFSVSEDGVVVLGNSPYQPFPYDNYFAQDPALLGQTPAYPILLPWGEDLRTAGNGSISYKITGASPSRKLIIQFNVTSVEGQSENFNKSFQVWLFEGSNKIQFVYGDITSDWYNNANIGIAASAKEFLSVDCSSQTASATTVAMNSDGSFEPLVIATLPKKEMSYVFSPTAIPDAEPIAATLSMFPAFPVPGQKEHTIYLDYGTQTVQLMAAIQNTDKAASAFTYAWSPADGLSSASAAAPFASPKVSTTYTVTISDDNGNTTTASITVNVIDPREGDKFKVCKLGKTTICISKEAVDTQLKSGATLGACAPSLGFNGNTDGLATTAMDALNASAGFSVYPNPSSGAFVVRTPGDGQAYSVSVADVAGRMVAQKSVTDGQQAISFDLSNRARGVYIIRMSGNGNVKTAKILIK